LSKPDEADFHCDPETVKENPGPPSAATAVARFVTGSSVVGGGCLIGDSQGVRGGLITNDLIDDPSCVQEYPLAGVQVGGACLDDEGDRLPRALRMSCQRQEKPRKSAR
jgi:hypothetical protein